MGTDAYVCASVIVYGKALTVVRVCVSVRCRVPPGCGWWRRGKGRAWGCGGGVCLSVQGGGSVLMCAVLWAGVCGGAGGGRPWRQLWGLGREVPHRLRRHTSTSAGLIAPTFR